ncbi:MAG: ABC transporter substrate-binding protein [Reyranella sp.]|nr:ABC transporter substrate-binding protein [Reyranella sp.]
MFKRLRVAAAGFGLLAATAMPALSQGTLRIGMTAADIPQTTGQPDQGFEGFRFAGYTIYDALVNWDLSKADTIADIRPGLALSWAPIEGEPTKWIFKLREGVKFHDGSDFDADAVVWNLDKVLNDKSPQFDRKQMAQARARIPTLVGYKAIDKYTIELTTRVVNSLFPYDMSYIFYSSPAQWEKLGKDWNKVALQPSGTGPFKVDRVVPRERLELSRNADYWEKARVPKLDKVLLFPMPEAATRTAALLAGQVDWIEVPAPDAIPRLRQGGMMIVTNKYPHNWAYQPSMVEGSPWTDIRVRKAANLAIDRAGINKLLGGLMIEAKGAVYPGHPWFGSPSFDIKYDPAAAKKLLAEAGYSATKKPKIKIAISTSGSGQMLPLPMNEYVQENLNAVGFDTEFEVMEWNSLISFSFQPATGPDAKAKGVNGINISRATVDPYSAFMRLYHSSFVSPAGANWGILKDPKVDEMINKAHTTFDRAAQTKALADVHTYIVDQSYWVYIAHDLNPRAMSPKVKGFVQAQSWFQDLTTVEMAK